MASMLEEDDPKVEVEMEVELEEVDDEEEYPIVGDISLSRRFLTIQGFLSVFHLVQTILGAVMVAKFHYDHYSDFAPKGFAITALILGISAFIGRIVAVVAVQRSNNIMNIFKLVLIGWCLLKMAEIGLGIAAFGLRDDMEKTIFLNVNEDMITYTGNETETHIDHLQIAFRCCGSTDPFTWQYTPWGIVNLNHYPDSCCLEYSDRCGASPEAVIHKEGCAGILSETATHDITVFSAILLTLTILEMFVSTVLMARDGLCRDGGEFKQDVLRKREKERMEREGENNDTWMPSPSAEREIELEDENAIRPLSMALNHTESVGL